MPRWNLGIKALVSRVVAAVKDGEVDEVKLGVNKQGRVVIWITLPAKWNNIEPAGTTESVWKPSPKKS